MKHATQIFATTLGLALCLLVATPALAADREEISPPELAPPSAETVALAATVEAAPAATVEENVLPATPGLEGLDFRNTVLIWNPCYTFDNSPPGCYRTWSPQTWCCKGTGQNGCYDVCY